VKKKVAFDSRCEQLKKPKKKNTLTDDYRGLSTSEADRRYKLFVMRN